MNILQFLIDFQTKGDSGAAASVGKLQNNLDNARRSTESLTSRIGGSLKNAIMSLPGAEFFTNPIVAISAGIGVVTKLGMTAEQTAISFEVLLGSQKKAAALMQEMKTYGAKTSYENPDVYNAAKIMLGYGISYQKIMPYMKMLGDIASGDANKLNSLALVFSQVFSAGKLQGQDLLQFINTTFNPMENLMKLTGKSAPKLREEMEKGKISFDMVAKAMELATNKGGRYFGMMDRQGKTAAGKLSTLFDSLRDKLLILYGAIAPILIPALDILATVLDSITGPLAWLVEKFNSFVTIIKSGIDLLVTGNPIMWGMVAAIATYAVVVNGLNIVMGIWSGITKIATAIQWLFNAALSLNPIGLTIALLAGLITATVLCWNKFAGFRAFLLTMWDEIKNSGFFALLSTLWDLIKGLGIIIKDYVVDQFKRLVLIFELCWNKFSGFRIFLVSMWDVIKGFGTIINDYVLARIVGLITGIGSLGSALSKLFKGDFKGAWSDAKTGALNIWGFETKNASKTLSSWGNSWSDSYNKNLSQQKALQKTKDAADKSGTSTSTIKNKATISPANTKNGATESAVTGGTRNNIITVNIGKLIETLVVHQFDKINTREFEALVVESMTRAIEIATSSAR